MSRSPWRDDFPILRQTIHGHPLTYLDSAASAQRPQNVIDALVLHDRENHANVHRGVHTLATRATQSYERAREVVARFVHAEHAQCIVFTRGTTSAINLVAHSYARAVCGPQDQIVITPMEHHANLIPWQQVARACGASLVYAPLQDDGDIDIDGALQCITERTRIVALSHVSNVLGMTNDVQPLIDRAHAVGAYVVIDGAQSAPHQPIDVQKMNCDFFTFSGHKIGAPTGIGVLYGKPALLERMEPIEFGGEMIDFVGDVESTWKDPPLRFEAGTPLIHGAIGLAAAIEYIECIGMERIQAHDAHLAHYAYDAVRAIPDVTVYGPARGRTGLVSFNVGGIHAHDIATFLDAYGIAVRAGHHCAQPLMRWLRVPATVRASFYVYNDEHDVDRLVDVLQQAKEYFSDAT